MRRILLVVAAGACGRVNFDPLAGGDGGADDDGGDASTARANRVFATRGTTDGAFGGVAGADAICQQFAQTAGLPGTFRAYLATATQSARTRLAGSRGWIRTDGVAVADRPEDVLQAGAMLNPISVNENGQPLGPATPEVWTGTDTGGNPDALGRQCGDWTNPTQQGVVGLWARSSPHAMSFGPQSCGATAHLYCFEVGYAVEVTPTPTVGRVAFVASSRTDVGLAGLDAVCQMNALTAGLTGTFVAAVATPTTTIASRFPGATPYRRPDGTLVSASGPAMFDGSDRLSFINQAADGNYVANQYSFPYITGAAPMAVGSNATTCNNWTATNGSPTAGWPQSILGAEVWSSTTASCSVATQPMLCLEQ